MNNNNDIEKDSLLEMRSEMETFKNSLPASGLISESDIRRLVLKKSGWLSRFVYGEIISLPIIFLIMFGFAVYCGVNIWCVEVILLGCIVDVILDVRTMRVSKEWVENETVVGLIMRLTRQKKLRKRQLLIETPFIVIWVVWFIYEILKPLGVEVDNPTFLIVWGIMSVVILAVAYVIIMIIYKKAQSTNDAMIKELDSLTD